MALRCCKGYVVPLQDSAWPRWAVWAGSVACGALRCRRGPRRQVGTSKQGRLTVKCWLFVHYHFPASQQRTLCKLVKLKNKKYVSVITNTTISIRHHHKSLDVIIARHYHPSSLSTLILHHRRLHRHHHRPSASSSYIAIIIIHHQRTSSS